MSTIRVNCIDQALAFENTPLITSGGLDENFVSFTFCGEWDGFERTAVFWRNEADAYHVLLDEANTCQIPPEVTTDEGTVYFGVFGVNAQGKQRTSAVLTYRIVKGAITVGTAPSDPTPDIYTQFLAKVGVCVDLVQETRDAETAFEEAMAAKQQAHVEAVEDDQAEFAEAMNAKQVAYEKAMNDAYAEFVTENGGLSEETAAMYGLSIPARPDDALRILGRLHAGLGNEYVWEKIQNGVVSGYVNSPDPSAYPPTVSDGFTYTLLGQLGEKTRIETGSYVGTNTFGRDNPNKLTFGFVPKFVIITSLQLPRRVYGLSDRHTFIDYTALIKANKDYPGLYGSFYIGYNGAWTENMMWLSDDNKTLNWWNTQNASNQLNLNNLEYHYIAIG